MSRHSRLEYCVLAQHCRFKVTICLIIGYYGVGGIRNFAEGIFLVGGRNLRRSNLNL